jgi:hypothetical protein
MAITDIRAQSTLNGLPITQGSVSDSFATGGGWITTTGQVTLLGLHSFSIGGTASINTIPRTLYVLGVCPDPYSNITIVTVGCRLSVLRNQVPDINQELEDLEQEQCEDDIDTYAASGFRGQGVITDLGTIWSKCMNELGFTGSLTSGIKIHVSKKDGFDFSSGYLRIAEEILVSEAKYAYADGTQIRVITPGNSGLYIYGNTLLDLSASSTTDVPKKDALIRYETVEITPPDDGENVPEVEEPDAWTKDETQGEKPQRVKYERRDNGVATYLYNHDFVSYTSSETTYYDEVKPPDNPTCEEQSYEPSFEELVSGKIKERITKQRVTLGNDCQAYCEFLIDIENVEPNYELEGFVTTTETYTYDDFGELSKVETVTVQPQFLAFSDLPNLLGIDGDYVSLTAFDMEVEKTVVEYTNIYENGGFVNDRIYKTASGDYKLLKGRKTKTSRYVPYFKTNNFRHRLQVMRELGQLSSIEDIGWVWDNLVFPIGPGENCEASNLISSEIVTEAGRDITSFVQSRPTGKLPAQSGDITQSKLETPEFQNLTKSEKFTFRGHDFGEGFTEYSVPFTGSDYYKRYGSPGSYTWRKKEGDRSNLGRCAELQHRMAFGRTAAYTAVIPASRCPTSPLFSARIQNLSAQFICSGVTWQLSDTGAVAALDLVLWSNTVSGFLPSYPGTLNTVWDVTYNDQGDYLTASQISDYLGTTEWYVDNNNTVTLDPSGTGDYSNTQGNLLLPDGEVAEGNQPPVWVEEQSIELVTQTTCTAKVLSHELTNTLEQVDITTRSLLIYGPKWIYPQAGTFTKYCSEAPYIIDRFLALDPGNYTESSSGNTKLIQTYPDLLANAGAFSSAGFAIDAKQFTYQLECNAASFSLSGSDAITIADRLVPADAGSFTQATPNNLLIQEVSELFSYPNYNGTTTTTANGGYAMTTYNTYTSANYGTQVGWYVRFANLDINGNSIISPTYFNTTDTYQIEWGPDSTVWRMTFQGYNTYSGYIRLLMYQPSLDEYPYGTDDMVYSLNTLGATTFNANGVRILNLVENATSFLVYHGSYGLSGQDAIFKRALNLSASSGSYSVAGQAATLT